ncbi:TetR/AcrR family transcriptional regulator [Rhodococcus spelaei]|uniref:TetR/AcrR family transcriptional regulator n=1 Tax=Rhodococcus spelaei TaxID=2546320 RepID=A0A541B234_9NOCA|nr:TetR/AcrR family transcriptional regulator [Rhodococcus spelaei]TQF66371.1 TetR/AcrR family transcriptional regulator [Rhodococcus spelaei]
MTTAGPGRPRLTKQRRPGPTAQAEILDAAAELFTTRGFASTSTRQIAEVVGVRQASLYHHFSTKDHILAALLEKTVSAPLELANRLAGRDESAAVRLYALILFDSGQLMSGRWNLGALCLLPELRTERFARFRRERQLLCVQYEALSAAVLDQLGAGDAAGRAGLPFRIVETVINERSDAETVWDTETEGSAPGGVDSPALLADAGLRVLGWTDVESLRAPSEQLLSAAAT